MKIIGIGLDKIESNKARTIGRKVGKDHHTQNTQEAKWPISISI